jgi:hypothetical protein
LSKENKQHKWFEQQQNKKEKEKENKTSNKNFNLALSKDFILLTKEINRQLNEETQQTSPVVIQLQKTHNETTVNTMNNENKKNNMTMFWKHGNKTIHFEDNGIDRTEETYIQYFSDTLMPFYSEEQCQ